jgi:hypothetical protein
MKRKDSFKRSVAAWGQTMNSETLEASNKDHVAAGQSWRSDTIEKRTSSVDTEFDGSSLLNVASVDKMDVTIPRGASARQLREDATQEMGFTPPPRRQKTAGAGLLAKVSFKISSPDKSRKVRETVGVTQNGYPWGCYAIPWLLCLTCSAANLYYLLAAGKGGK